MAKEPTSDPNTAAARYKILAQDREQYLQTARECARLTLPFVMPPEGTQGQRLPQPWQSVGSRGVNNLSAKLLLALFPPNTPFFKLTVDRFELKKISKDAKTKTALEEALSEMEQAVLNELETCAARPTVAESLLHLIVTGNGLVEVPPKGSLKFYRLDRYVVQRDPMGAPRLIIIHESVAPSSLPEDFLKKVQGLNKHTGQQDTPKADRKIDPKPKNIDLYTVAERISEGQWETWQEAYGKEIPGTYTKVAHERLPYIPLRFTKIDGEDYGRGLVEHYLGDLVSYDGLSRALQEGSLAAAKVLFLVKPTGATDAKELAEADNGAFVAGDEEDVKALQLEKFYDFNTAKSTADSIEKRLNAAFLVFVGFTRDAERVTAEEIRALIQELETSLGGVYSVQAHEYQLPLATALMARMASQQRLPKLPKKIVAPTITTGVEALGRGNDLQKLDLLVKDIVTTFGPEAVARYVVPGEYFARRATALGINSKGLIRTEEEVQQEAADQQNSGVVQSLTEKLGPAAIRELGAASRQAPTQ